MTAKAQPTRVPIPNSSTISLGALAANPLRRALSAKARCRAAGARPQPRVRGPGPPPRDAPRPLAGDVNAANSAGRSTPYVAALLPGPRWRIRLQPWGRSGTAPRSQKHAPIAVEGVDR
jgi:hypothetical protein